MLGPVLPGLRRDTGAGDIASGVFLAASGGFWGAGVFVSGPLQQRRGRRLSFRLGMIALALGMALLAAAPSMLVAVPGAALASFGGGLVSGAVNATMAEYDAGALAVTNAFFGVGAIAGPALTAGVIVVTGSWRLAPLVAAVLAAVTVASAGAIPDRLPERHAARAGLGGLLRAPLFVVLMAVMSIEIASEAGLVGWFPIYAVNTRGFPEWLAAISPLAFWVGVTAARGLLARASQSRVRPIMLLPPMLASATVSVVLMLLLGSPVVAVALVLAVGCSVGAVFPLILTIARAWFPHDTDATTAILLGTSGTVEMLLPLVIGGASAAAGTDAAGIATIAVTFALSGVGTVVLRVATRGGVDAGAGAEPPHSAS
jgi:hypothetical protein